MDFKEFNNKMAKINNPYGSSHCFHSENCYSFIFTCQQIIESKIVYTSYPLCEIRVGLSLDNKVWFVIYLTSKDGFTESTLRDDEIKKNGIIGIIPDSCSLTSGSLIKIIYMNSLPFVTFEYPSANGAQVFRFIYNIFRQLSQNGILDDICDIKEDACGLIFLKKNAVDNWPLIILGKRLAKMNEGW